jgi:thiamine transporter ThiT
MKKVSQGLRITFLVHFVVGLIFGLVFLFIPKTYGDLVNWPVQDLMIYRVLGAAMLGFAASSILAYRETNWEKVIIVVRMEIVWTALGTLALLWTLIAGDAPGIAWLNAAILAAFAIAFGLFYNPA